ncbi:hypothetical protein GCM10009566_02010 [Streptomyces murinus]|uniref:Uncharacterized protein n=2 Tax=Actinomycetes TaxID=1760 RepID=A0ABP8SFH4_9ACTN|nr:hypothetical protein SRO_1847 [Streptomyces rochei]
MRSRRAPIGTGAVRPPAAAVVWDMGLAPWKLLSHAFAVLLGKEPPGSPADPGVRPGGQVWG